MHQESEVQAAAPACSISSQVAVDHTKEEKSGSAGQRASSASSGRVPGGRRPAPKSMITGSSASPAASWRVPPPAACRPAPGSSPTSRRVLARGWAAAPPPRLVARTCASCGSSQVTESLPDKPPGASSTHSIVCSASAWCHAGQLGVTEHTTGRRPSSRASSSVGSSARLARRPCHPRNTTSAVAHCGGRQSQSHRQTASGRRICGRRPANQLLQLAYGKSSRQYRANTGRGATQCRTPADETDLSYFSRASRLLTYFSSSLAHSGQ